MGYLADRGMGLDSCCLGCASDKESPGFGNGFEKKTGCLPRVKEGFHGDITAFFLRIKRRSRRAQLRHIRYACLELVEPTKQLCAQQMAHVPPDVVVNLALQLLENLRACKPKISHVSASTSTWPKLLKWQSPSAGRYDSKYRHGLLHGWQGL